MSRHSSVLPVSFSVPVIGNGHTNLPKSPEKQVIRTSVPKPPTVNDDLHSDLDPDELFTKHTIAEIKLVQQRLRADADVKQEELRLMVGERYRDLLQASTSIISIAKSSQAVNKALEETKDVLQSQKEPPLLQQPSSNDQNDTHLRTLQLLAVHIKILLDAPEHLWRLLETKKYFQATWLFLLARVVHQALVRADKQDEDTWQSQGVDVLEEFPLVQRQWDAVSQFRSQIIHKATLSLREHDSSVEATCAALLTLHLLDSRPLSEALSVFFAQRSKTLYTMFSQKLEFEPSTEKAGHRQVNGNASENITISSEFRRIPVNLVKEATHSALNALSQTLMTARSIFQAESNSHSSLIRHVLEFIESDSHQPPNSTKSFPELYLSTPTLLTTLPSSAHLLSLPSNITSYKPHVDLGSSSLSIHHSQFVHKLKEWFQQSCSSLHKASTRWFGDLQSVREVWSVRTSTRRWLTDSGLDNGEITQIIEILNDLCQQRVIEVWKLKLTRSLESFSERLGSTFSTLNQKSRPRQEVHSSGEFLFQAPPLPTPAQASLGPPDTTFPKYKATLRRQLLGRTSLLDDVLATLESCARTIRQDLAYIMAGDEESQELVEQLQRNYSPNADALSYEVVNKLEKTSQMPIESTSLTLDGLIFLGHISGELASSSPFISEVGCHPSVMEAFRDKTAALHDRIIDRWRIHTVPSIVHEHRLAFRPIHPSPEGSLKPRGPSSDLIQSLLTLCHSIQELGISRNPSKQRSLVQVALKQFVFEVVSNEDGGDMQAMHDASFLLKLASLQGDEWHDFSTMLEERLKERLPTNLNLAELQQIASEPLLRMQTLFATLLPNDHLMTLSKSVDKSSALLPFGAPLLDQQFQPAVELAKPASRFGLLLVGGS